MKTKTTDTSKNITRKQRENSKFLPVIVRSGSKGHNLEESGDRSIVSSAKIASQVILSCVNIDANILEKEILDVVTKFGSVIDKIPSSIGNFGLESVEFSLDISAKGKVGLMGSGGEIGGTGGLKFKLVKKSSLPEQ